MSMTIYELIDRVQTDPEFVHMHWSAIVVLHKVLGDQIKIKKMKKPIKNACCSSLVAHCDGHSSRLVSHS